MKKKISLLFRKRKFSKLEMIITNLNHLKYLIIISYIGHLTEN